MTTKLMNMKYIQQILLLRNHNHFAISKTRFSNITPGYMKAWQLQESGAVDDIKLDNVRVPTLLRPTDVLVGTTAASINTIDVAMMGGYGRDVISTMKRIGKLEQGQINCDQSVFPFIGGRDFSGEVVAIGQDVKNVNIGETVYGVVSPQCQGSHAEYVVAPSTNVNRVPDAISATEAASIPYAALTAWSAATVSGGLIPCQAAGKRVLVLGASGGVGSFLVQLLNVWGAEVTAVCSAESIDLVCSLGAVEVHDYRDSGTKQFLTSYPGFDLILDASGKNDSSFMKGLKQWSGASYVSLSPPLLRNTDRHGIVVGSIKSISEAVISNFNSLSDGRAHKWAFFMPNPWALSDITKMISKGKIKAVIDKIFEFEDTLEAYKHVIDGPARGKTVIEIKL